MLKQKFVFITGASSGIGESCAHYFAKAGANLILCSRHLDAVNKVAEAIVKTHGVKVHTFQLDVRDQAAVMASINALPEAWKHIDILVNNAGLAAGLDLIQEADISDWDAMIDTNVKGLLYVTKAVLPGMLERNAGHIFNIGSIAGHEVYPRGGVYCATKTSVNVLTRGLRMDLLGTKIRVTSIDPGAVETNFSIVRFKGDTQRAAAVYQGMEALTPDDVADAVLYCATCPPHINISELIIMPTDQAAVTMIARK